MPRKKKEPGEDAERRRDGLHCPVCLALLPRIAGQAGTARRCMQCGAEPAADQRCGSCGRLAVWTSSGAAACASCGQHGSKVRVIAGHRWLAEGGE